MAPAQSALTGIQIETATFPPAVKPPGSEKTVFLGGAGTLNSYLYTHNGYVILIN